MKKLFSILLAALLLLLAAAGCAPKEAAPAEGEAAYSPENPVTVKIGLTGAVYEDIWKPVAEELSKEGIVLEYVQFSNFSLPNKALANGEVDINAFQHHAFLENEVANYGYDVTPIGDTYIVAMGIYSGKLDDLSQLAAGDKVALPSDVTNEGRALKLLEAAGLLTIDGDAGASPTISDITAYTVPLEFVEVDANLVYSTLPDVAVAVINGNYALDSGLVATDALYMESSYVDNSYYCLIAARTEDAENPVYKRIVEAYQSQLTIDVFNSTFAGFFIPAWTLS
ncbi:MAG TPA: MetQ/NlpA family ABC transporter substrate-binding protein [Candidatus Acidoferrum sp.]|nr:MetQ/NlpA family ABC transporter substrate-binding protein [Candidatus Acidoferrum sp.]